MAYNTTDSDRQSAADHDLAVKMRREAVIKSAIFFGYFAKIGRDLQATYTELGIIPSLAAHDKKLTTELNHQYGGTQKVFGSQVRNALGKPDNSKFIDEQIGLSMEVQKLLHVHPTSRSIAQTTANSLNDAVSGVVSDAADAGVALSQAQIAKKARSIFIADSKDRLNTIAISQTEFAAEGAKNVEMGTLNRLNAVFPQANVNLAKDRVEKTWTAILDSVTREAHVRANGQVVAFNEPFLVMDEKLMYPGDTSLGATVRNIINCRCSSIKSIYRSGN